MADETEDVASKKQLSFCVRYVHEEEVREEFLGFVEIEKADASTIAANVLETANESGLNLDNLVGQGYDGASVMRSPKNGVIIKRQYPKALFVHCRSHNLALVVSSSCIAIPTSETCLMTSNRLHGLSVGVPRGNLYSKLHQQITLTMEQWKV